MSWLSNFFSTGGTQEESTGYLPVQATWLTNLLNQYGGQVGQGQASGPSRQSDGYAAGTPGVAGQLGAVPPADDEYRPVPTDGGHAVRPAVRRDGGRALYAAVRR